EYGREKMGPGSRRVAVSLPLTFARELRTRTAPWDVGGVAASFAARDGRSATLVLWRTPPAIDGATPIGRFAVVWSGDGNDDAVVREVTWDSPHTEQEVWQGIEVLAREPLPRSKQRGPKP